MTRRAQLGTELLRGLLRTGQPDAVKILVPALIRRTPPVVQRDVDLVLALLARPELTEITVELLADLTVADLGTILAAKSTLPPEVLWAIAGRRSATLTPHLVTRTDLDDALAAHLARRRGLTDSVVAEAATHPLLAWRHHPILVPFTRHRRWSPAAGERLAVELLELAAGGDWRVGERWRQLGGADPAPHGRALGAVAMRLLGAEVSAATLACVTRSRELGLVNDSALTGWGVRGANGAALGYIADAAGERVLHMICARRGATADVSIRLARWPDANSVALALAHPHSYVRAAGLAHPVAAGSAAVVVCAPSAGAKEAMGAAANPALPLAAVKHAAGTLNEYTWLLTANVNLDTAARRQLLASEGKHRVVALLAQASSASVQPAWFAGWCRPDLLLEAVAVSLNGNPADGSTLAAEVVWRWPDLTAQVASTVGFAHRWPDGVAEELVRTQMHADVSEVHVAAALADEWVGNVAMLGRVAGRVASSR